MTPGKSCLAVAKLLAGLLKQNTKFLFRQDTMFSSDMLQRYICAEIAKCAQR